MSSAVRHYSGYKTGLCRKQMQDGIIFVYISTGEGIKLVAKWESSVSGQLKHPQIKFVSCKIQASQACSKHHTEYTKTAGDMAEICQSTSSIDRQINQATEHSYLSSNCCSFRKLKKASQCLTMPNSCSSTGDTLPQMACMAVRCFGTSLTAS